MISRQHWIPRLALWMSCAALLAPGIAMATKPVFTSPSSTTFTVGVPGTFTVTATGDPTPTIDRKGPRLPAGVTFHDNHDGTGTLAGTPGPGTARVYSFKFRASNGQRTSQNFTLTVDQAPAITSAASTTCAVGVACTFTVTATGFPVPSIVRTGATLPTGMNYVDNGDGTGTLSGTPGGGTQGNYALIFTAANGVGSDAVQNFSLTVNSFLAFTSPANTTCQVGTFCTFNITATGIPLPSIALSGGSLPAVMQYVDNGNGTGTLSGTPAAGTGGQYALDFTAHNGVEPDAVQSFTLTVNEPPAIASAASLTCAIGESCSLTVTTMGFPAPTINISGDTLPVDVTFFDNGDGTGMLSGIPDPATDGVYHLVFSAANGIGPDALQNFTLTVNPSLAITSADSTTCIVGVFCTFTVTATGVPAPAIAISGATLPSALNFADNNDGTGTLSGTPGTGTAGTYLLSFTASNLVETNAVQSFTLTVHEAPAITSASATTCVAGTPCTFTVTATGLPVPAIARTGDALPVPVTYFDNGDGTGSLSGTPNAGTGGVYHLVFTASNGIGSDATQNFTLTVNQAPDITSAPPADGLLGAAYNHLFVATGFPAPTFSVTAGGLPTNLVLSAAGTISGTPTATGTFTGTVTATNGTAPDATQNFSITITSPATVPTAPFGVGALSGNALATISFSPPASDGGSTITGYTVICTPMSGAPVMASDVNSPITVPGLSNGVTYTCTVHATNGIGDGPDSAASNPVTPSAAAPAALTVSITGSGTGTVTSSPAGIACPGDCSETYPAGTGTVLTATASGGSVFTGWLGSCIGASPTCIVTVDTASAVSAGFAPPGTAVNLDVDQSAPGSAYDALTDGLLVIRYMFGLTGTAMTDRAVAATATRTTATAILDYLNDIRPALDVDGNGQVDALTDGLLILRYLFGLTGPALTDRAIGPGAIRATPAAIETYLQALTP